MIRILLSLITIIFICNLNAQTAVTFRLNMQHLIEKKLFKPENEKVFVRGNFNGWKENNCELKKNNSENIYSGTFNINANIGDTIEFKFILESPHSRTYWERKPNPENPNYSNRKLVITGSNFIAPLMSFNYDEFIKYPVLFSKVKLHEDFWEVRKTLEEKHPALYDYTDKQTLDSIFDYYYLQIDTALSFNEFYKNISSVLVHIGCGHTKLWIPQDYWQAAPNNFFPLKLLFIENKIYVSGHYSASMSIPVGSEIISINKNSIREILKTLESITSSDAFIRAFKLKSVEKNFSKKYALYYGYPENFIVEFIPPGSLKVKETELQPVDLSAINAHPVRGNKLSLRLLENHNAALLTINTFIYYDQLEKFKSFIDSSFRVIKNEKIKNLIIDLRGNDGGDPFCSSYLLSYIESEPVAYFAEPYGRYNSLSEPIPMAANNFIGNIYTLIDGSCFSTTGHFVSLLKYNHVGKLVGTETGATFTCTGSVHYIDLKNTKLILGTAQKQRYSTAVQNMDRRRGVMPDFHVEQSQNDIVTKKDAVFNFVLDLIGSNHGNSDAMYDNE